MNAVGRLSTAKEKSLKSDLHFLNKILCNLFEPIKSAALIMHEIRNNFAAISDKF